MRLALMKCKLVVSMQQMHSFGNNHLPNYKPNLGMVCMH